MICEQITVSLWRSIIASIMLSLSMLYSPIVLPTLIYQKKSYSNILKSHAQILFYYLLFSTFYFFPFLCSRLVRPAVLISSELPDWSPCCRPSPTPPVPAHSVFHGVHARSASLTHQWPNVTLPCHQLTHGPSLHHRAFQHQYGLRTQPQPTSKYLIIHCVDSWKNHPHPRIGANLYCFY